MENNLKVYNRKGVFILSSKLWKWRRLIFKSSAIFAVLTWNFQEKEKVTMIDALRGSGYKNVTICNKAVVYPICERFYNFAPSNCPFVIYNNIICMLRKEKCFQAQIELLVELRFYPPLFDYPTANNTRQSFCTSPLCVVQQNLIETFVCAHASK